MTEQQEGLREGFTTGTAAAAAAFAAVSRLLGLPVQDSAAVALPPFSMRDGCLLPETASRLTVRINDSGIEEQNTIRTGWADVVKDGGDDPDATHGARVTAHARLSPFPPADFSAARPVRVHNCGIGVTLYGGQGIGIVTLPGLPAPPGEPAINPEPRKQIAFAAAEAARECGYSGELHVRLSVPDGKDRARRTMNARLGIVGGISILGTRGTVRPYSHDAWKATIAQGMSVAEAVGCRELLLSTGRRSERLGFTLYPALAPQAGIQVADYAAFSLREAAQYDFSHLIWLCFPGKLLKLAQGLEWTHAKNAPADIRFLADRCADAGADAGLVRAVREMPTASGAFELMEAAPEVHTFVLRHLGRQAMRNMHSWINEGSAPVCRPDLRLHVFSLDERLLLTLP